MKVKVRKKCTLFCTLTNSAWIEANSSVGETFDHLTQLYTLVHEGMKQVSPEYKEFSFEQIEMIINEDKKEYLTDAMIETKRLVDNYMVKFSFPCLMEFAG
jgi:hypothetical protein